MKSSTERSTLSLARIAFFREITAQPSRNIRGVVVIAEAHIEWVALPICDIAGPAFGHVEEDFAILITVELIESPDVDGVIDVALLALEALLEIRGVADEVGVPHADTDAIVAQLG